MDDLKNKSIDGSGDDIILKSDDKKSFFDKIPEYGWSVRMDHVFPETGWNQNLFRQIKLRQIPDLLPLFIRYFIWWIGTSLFRRRKPFIDLRMLEGKRIYGVPIGGIGSGTIGRGFRGEFTRFQMTPGLYTYNTVHENQFILQVQDANGLNRYQKVLSGCGPPKGILEHWDWSYNPADGHYKALYPRAWYTFNVPEENLTLVCKQISPIIPHNYKDSCMPSAVFVWKIDNQSSETKRISITFTFKNGDGSSKKLNCSSQSFSSKLDDAGNKNIYGVALEHEINGNPTTYSLAAIERDGQAVTHMTSFDLKRGSDIWAKLTERGCLDKESSIYEIRNGEIGIAVCCSAVVPPKSQEDMIFCLAWDQPNIYFNNKEFLHTRRYTRFFKAPQEEFKELKLSTQSVSNIIRYSLSNYVKWNNEIEAWQNPILDDDKLPDWFKSALFNELYFISDGGSVWLQYKDQPLPRRLNGPKEDLRVDFGRFAYLEAHEYRMYNTYDVHFYSSIALVLLWPKLQLSLQYDLADAIILGDSTNRRYLFNGNTGFRKTPLAVPHDLGDPCEDPYLYINSYLMHDTSQWKDLNLKFVLQVFRDFRFTEDIKYLKDMLPICDIIMRKSYEMWDKDGDGLIENEGFPDQTYDTWIMKGPSSYCGGLWLAALFAMIEMLKETGQDSERDKNFYTDILNRGKQSFQEKLWNGKYYKFDSSSRENSHSIMSDQLCGHWSLAMCGFLEEPFNIFPRENVKTALKTIYENNVKKFCNGKMGAVNGCTPDGKVDTYTMQSEEMWVGVAYAFASTLAYNGMTKEAFDTAEGVYRTIYEKIGLGFETPEALYESKKYRAIGYMRPLSIWSIYHAIKQTGN